MRFVIDHAGGDAPFSQVRSQIEAAINQGELPVGTRLPAIRTLADAVGVAPGTVARAYRELGTRGLVDTRGRHGTFVADPAENRMGHRQQLSQLAAVYARTAARFGIRPAEAINLVDQALREEQTTSG